MQRPAVGDRLEAHRRGLGAEPAGEQHRRPRRHRRRARTGGPATRRSPGVGARGRPVRRAAGGQLVVDRQLQPSKQLLQRPLAAEDLDDRLHEAGRPDARLRGPATGSTRWGRGLRRRRAGAVTAYDPAPAGGSGSAGGPLGRVHTSGRCLGTVGLATSSTTGGLGSRARLGGLLGQRHDDGGTDGHRVPPPVRCANPSGPARHGQLVGARPVETRRRRPRRPAHLQ